MSYLRLQLTEVAARDYANSENHTRRRGGDRFGSYADSERSAERSGWPPTEAPLRVKHEQEYEQDRRDPEHSYGDAKPKILSH
jgi:hypothetical protein